MDIPQFKFGFRGKSICVTEKSGRVMHDFQTEWIIMTIDILYLSFYFDTLAHLQNLPSHQSELIWGVENEM